MSQGEDNITSAIFLLQMQNLNLAMGKQETNQTEEHASKKWPALVNSVKNKRQVLKNESRLKETKTT